MITIEKRIEKTIHGDVAVYKMTNTSGAWVELQSIGAGIRAINVPDRDGVLADVVLGYKDISDYMGDGPCAGKTPGRYANRIANGDLTVGGKKYKLNINCGPNSLHGGPKGFSNQIWNSEVDINSVKFTYNSPDGEEFFPGNLNAEVVYEWNEQNELIINYKVVTDAPTVVNLTNHSYFNLDGENAGADAMLDHELMLNAECYLPTDESLVPVGVYEKVAGTPMDFRTAKRIGNEINADFQAIKYAKGYDSSWIINNWIKGKMQMNAVLSSKNSGRIVEIYSTQPAAQVYTGNWLSDSPINKNGGKYTDYAGVAVECQGMPDAPNKPNFPSQELRPGEEYKQIIKYCFKNK